MNIIYLSFMIINNVTRDIMCQTLRKVNFNEPYAYRTCLFCFHRFNAINRKFSKLIMEVTSFKMAALYDTRLYISQMFRAVLLIHEHKVLLIKKPTVEQIERTWFCSYISYEDFTCGISKILVYVARLNMLQPMYNWS